MRMALVLVMLLSGVSGATTLQVQGDLRWTGEPTPDGDAKWPATLEIDFDPTYTEANVKLDGMPGPYSGSWMMTDYGMTSGQPVEGNTDFTSDKSRFLVGTDVSIELEMEPLASLDDTTVFDIEHVIFEWAHPAFNDVAPVSFLRVEGKPAVTIPEPDGLVMALLCLGFVLAMWGMTS